MGFRVIKTAIATLLAILIADTAGINGALSAGLLAILGVDVTRKRSIKSVSARFFASLLGLALSFTLFYLFGFHIWVLVLYILIAFPLIAKAHFKEGIVTSSVVVFRVFGGEDISLQTLGNQILLLMIGLGSAMLVNLVYMPKEEGRLAWIRYEVDSLFAGIFQHIAETLRNPEIVWDGKELLQASEQIDKGLTIAKRALENQVIYPNESWNVYFVMRKQHLERIESMVDLISQVYRKMPHTELAAALFVQLSEDVRKEIYTGKTEKLLKELEEDFKKMDLPVSREEFESRAAILQLCRELGMYLNISKKDKKPQANQTQGALSGGK
ncbi:aromatic acid exporter family protein [Paenibacillus caui]|uniref:aromatic acid exporter family protein n=1 Tax=Paenibacillus caui TaxID=2873927 RepID=UPI001CA971E2|nr:aromatic acid exporter family protein [Paenibacillus caui]